MLTPDQCTSLEEVRVEIDTLDHQIVALIGQRLGYVKAAARFKASEEVIPDLERQAAMLEQRRRWATDYGLNPDLIVDLYQRLIFYFISEELQHWSGDPALND